MKGNQPRWPLAAAARTKFYRQESKNSGNTGNEFANNPVPVDEDDIYVDVHTYKLAFNKQKKQILIIKDETEIDQIIDPMDIIGVDLQLQFNGLENIITKTSNDRFNKGDIGNKRVFLKCGSGNNVILDHQHDPNQKQLPPVYICDSRGKNNVTTSSRREKNKDESLIRNVGIHNKKSRNRSIEMEFDTNFEKELHRQYVVRGKVYDADVESNDEFHSEKDQEDCSGLIFSGCRNDNTVTNSHSVEEEDEIDNNALTCLNFYLYPRKTRPKNVLLHKLNASGILNFKQQICKNNETDENNVTYDERYFQHIRLEVAPSGDFADIRSIVRAIRILANISEQYGKKYLVVLNPVSGNKRTKSVYVETVAPMLEKSGLQHDLFTTSYPGNAGERMTETYAKVKKGNPKIIRHYMVGESKDVSEYDGIIAMGGDGILSEILQGLNTRNDYDQIMRKLVFGVIGCGTNNGLASSLLHWGNEKFSPVESTFLICKGYSATLDMSCYQAIDDTYTSFLAYSWGMIADINIESEHLFGGGQQLYTDVWTAWKVVSLNYYRARFSFLAPSSDHNFIASWQMPSLDDPVPSHWETVEDDFVFLRASHLSHAALNKHISPYSKLNDGVFQVMIVRKPVSRYDLMTILNNFENGSHVADDKVEFYPCIAYRLEPLTSGSLSDLDGERIKSDVIQAYVLPSAIRVFACKK